MTKKNDMPAQCTVDRCKMATLAMFFEQQGKRVRSISHLTRLTIETLEMLVVEKLGAERITNTATAKDILEPLSYGKAYLESDRYASAALKNMQLDAEEDLVELGPIPQPRGRKPQWDTADELRMREAAEKALTSPKIQELMNKLKNGESK